ncbi:MAG: WD40/YVTN/BNR-like repeat-containing protein, partial [Chitinophagales bacterium]
LLLAYEWDYIAWVGNVCLYASDNLGESFEKINCWDEPTYGGASNFAMWTPRYGTPETYLVVKDSVFYLDADLNFDTLGTIPVTGAGEKILTGFQDDETTYLYLANCDWSDGTRIYGSDDSGLTWEERGLVPSGNFSRRSFSASQKNEGYLWLGGVNCFRSFNGGNSFTLINEWWEYYGAEINRLHADIPYIEAFLDTTTNTETLLISTDGGLYTSANNGLTNTNITMEGMRNAQYYDIYTYRYVPDIIFAGSQDQGYQRSSYNLGGNYYFDQLISGDYGHLVSANGGDHLWMVYPGFAMLSVDASGPGGLYFWDFIGYGHLWLPPLMADPVDPEQV